MLAVASYLTVAGAKPAATSRKAQQAKAMREAYQLMARQASISNNKNVQVSPNAKSKLSTVRLTSSSLASTRRDQCR
jgi:hypothetical protein